MTRLIALALLLLAATPLAAQDRSAAFVAQVKAALVAKGQTFTTNCDAFAITGRVAWALRSQGAKLFKKSAAQNGCTIPSGPRAGERYSHDAISFPNGWADLLTSAGPPANVNGPGWQWTPGVRSATDPTVADPFDLDAGAPIVTPPIVTPPIDAPPGLPPQMLVELVAKLIVEIQTLRQEVDLLTAGIASTRSDLTDLRLQAAHGLTGQLFGYPIVLKPVP
jgi:hypothetical protein